MTPPSFTGRRWQVRSPRVIPADAPPHVSLPLILQALSELRGTEAESGAFDPVHFPDLPRALERLDRALGSCETIGVFGDYDCDGITGTAQVVRMLRRRGADPVVRLPHRIREGYGLKVPHVLGMREKGVTLLLTVDTGISSVEAVDAANMLGMDVIVLDHHHVPEAPPKAHATLHPALAPSFGPVHPCASGVAHLFVSAVEGGSWDGMMEDRTLAMAGTVADLVELKGGNRVMTMEGLRAFSSLRDCALADLRDAAGIAGIPTSRDVAFRIAPRINAAGRMADPHLALKALLGDRQALLQLETLNRDRQQVTQTHWEELNATLDRAAPFLCTANAAYTPGIVGLLAGKLTEATGKPSFVGAIQGDRVTGSLRSVQGYHVAQGLERASDLLTHFGGHAQAAGCTLTLANLEAFADRMAQDVAERMDPSALVPTYAADLAIAPQHLSLLLCRHIAELEPFGQGNAEPRFILKNVRLSDPRVVGSTGTHLQARLGPHKLIGFNFGSFLDRTSEPLDLLVRVGVDTWNGRESVQLFLDDLMTPQTVASGQ